MDPVNGISMTCKCGAKFTVRNDDLTFICQDDDKIPDGKGRFLILEKIADRWMRLHKQCMEVPNGG